MPAKTEKQRRFFGAVMGAKKGQPGSSGKAKEVAKEMTKSQIKDYLKKSNFNKIGKAPEPYDAGDIMGRTVGSATAGAGLGAIPVGIGEAIRRGLAEQSGGLITGKSRAAQDFLNFVNEIKPPDEAVDDLTKLIVNIGLNARRSPGKYIGIPAAALATLGLASGVGKHSKRNQQISAYNSMPARFNRTKDAITAGAGKLKDKASDLFKNSEVDYSKGFITKCAELGIDPEVLIKQSVGFSSVMPLFRNILTRAGAIAAKPYASVARRFGATTHANNVTTAARDMNAIRQQDALRKLLGKLDFDLSKSTNLTFNKINPTTATMTADGRTISLPWEQLPSGVRRHFIGSNGAPLTTSYSPGSVADIDINSVQKALRGPGYTALGLAGTTAGAGGYMARKDKYAEAGHANESLEIYAHGFMDKCAGLGVDPELLIKQAIEIPGLKSKSKADPLTATKTMGYMGGLAGALPGMGTGIAVGSFATGSPKMKVLKLIALALLGTTAGAGAGVAGGMYAGAPIDAIRHIKND